MKTMTPKAVARMYGVHVDTVRDWIRSNLLPATDCRRANATRPRYRMNTDDLEAFEKQRAVRQQIRDARASVRVMDQETDHD